MNKPLRKTLLGLFLATAVWAQAMPKAGQVYESKSIDLTGDGKPEKVALVAHSINNNAESFAGQLRVVNSQGKILWQGPKLTQSGVPFSFGSWPYGVSGLGWLGDIDGDKKIELLSANPVSDVRPFTFQRYRWDGKAFRSLGQKMLLESAPNSGRFLWKDPFEWDGESPLTWGMTPTGDPSRCLVEVMSYAGNGQYRTGQAIMKGDGLGLTVTGWARPMEEAR